MGKFKGRFGLGKIQFANPSKPEGRVQMLKNLMNRGFASKEYVASLVMQQSKREFEKQAKKATKKGEVPTVERLLGEYNSVKAYQEFYAELGWPRSSVEEWAREAIDESIKPKRG